MSETQSNTKQGLIPVLANEDLTGKEGYLVKIVDAANTPKAALPTDEADETPYIVAKGGAADSYVDLLPLDPARNMRVYAKGAGNAGERLVHADPATAADKGKVETLPADADTYFSPGIAEEDWEDGQLVKFRPMPKEIVVV